MNRIITFLLLLFCLGAAAQSDRIPAKSPVTLIYKIDDAAADKLYRNKRTKIDDRLLRQCVDTLRGAVSFLPEGYPKGHYLMVNASGNMLQCRLASSIPFEHRMLNNQTDMSVAVFDRQTGKIVTDARVKIGNKRLRFDRQTQSYRRRKTDKQGILSVEVDGLTAYYKVTRQYDLNWWKRLKDGLWNAPVVKYVSRPVIFIASVPADAYRSIRDLRTTGTIRTVEYSARYPRNIVNAFTRKHHRNVPERGFMVFGKPKYRPGDTIRLKAYVVDKKDRPVNDSLALSVLTEKSQHIRYVKPYRPGFFAAEFVPKPSYGMKLDKHYTVELSETGKKAEKNKVLQSERFYYEDYELKSAKYNLRAEKKEYLAHEEVIFYTKAVDENDMPMPDARAELTLSTENIVDFGGEQVTVRDTLWKKNITLDPAGETKIVVPVDVWPDASIDARMIASFSNSDNQTDRKEVKFTRKRTAEQIVLTQHADSLYIRYENEGKAVDGVSARIRREPLRDTVLVLPARMRIHPLTEKYDAVLIGRLREGQALPMVGNPRLFQKTVSRSDRNRMPMPSAVFTPSESGSGVACVMNRTRDSLYVSIDNPYRLPLIYTVYRGNKEKARGTGSSITYKAKADDKDYFLSVQYVWGGKEHRSEYRSVYDAAQLKITGVLPTIVYPGQTVKVNIAVTDADGNPAPNVDLTAWGYTAKFGEQPMPRIPSYQKSLSNRKSYNAFTSGKPEKQNRSRELDYPKQRVPLKLDSVEMYRFAYPGKEMYRYSFPSSDGKTYISPYLVHEGKLYPVQILYINDRPVYFNHTTADAPYVFPVLSDYLHIRWRTADREIKAEVRIVEGHKNIISLDPYSWDRRIVENGTHVRWGTVEDRKKNYSVREIGLMRRYLMPLRAPLGSDFMWLGQDSLYQIIPETNYNWQRRHIAGPFLNTPVTFGAEDREVLTFPRDAGEWFEYEPLPGILKMRTIDFDKTMKRTPPPFGWRTEPYSKKYTDSIAQARIIQRMRVMQMKRSKLHTGGTLRVETKLNDSIAAMGWCWILHDRKRRETYIYPLSERSFRYVPEGDCTLFLLMADKRYYMRDSVRLSANAVTMLRLNPDTMKLSRLPIDASYMQERELLQDMNIYSGLDVTVPAADPLSELVEYNPEYVGEIEVWGRVTEKSGEPLPGAFVRVAGTVNGAACDPEGNYRIKIPEGYRLLSFSFIGYNSVYIRPTQNNENVNVALEESARELEEVIVVGYGTQRKHSLTESIVVDQTLTGKMSGIAISTSGSAVPMRIRGISSVDATSVPLYVVDGVIVSNIDNISPESVVDIQVLKDAAATSLYGSRAAGGVIVITTKGQALAMPDAKDMMNRIIEDENYQAGLAGAKGLRTDFSDEAFWQPALTTDSRGLASFEATFPDDITKWNLRFAGLLPGKASAATQMQVRSFKPLAGQLAVPRFLVEGDTAGVIGKAINYGADTVRLKTEFAVNDVVQSEKQAAVRHSQIDTLAVTAPEIAHPHTADSIAVSYTLTRDDGYRDGERRYIPVVRRGTTESVGQFHVLNNDTAFTLSFDAGDGPMTLSLESHALDILMKEMRYLRDYRHLCNEQSASRLKALLLERKAYRLLGKDYPYDKQIRALIDRLCKGRNEKGLWGWIGGGESEAWISTHVAEALLQAREDGFEVDTNFSGVVDRLVWMFDAAGYRDKVSVLHTLTRLSPATDYREMFEKIRPDSLHFFTDSLRWMELSLHFGKNPDIGRVLQRRRVDRLGNIRWEEPERKRKYWAYDDVSATLAAYRLLRAEGQHKELLPAVRNFLYYRRGSYCWRNTYESADILTAIYPDIIASHEKSGKTRITLSGGHTAVIDTFPKQIVLNGKEPVRITKSGVFPVYLTASREVYNKRPEAADKGFRVETRFTATDGDRSSIAALTAGKPATLEVAVSSDIPSEYVLIEIPIPAGCSYQSKSQSGYWFGGESHREYFRDRVCIYLRNLNKGKHTFRVELMPRYTGVYHVNPAKAERMYMPLYYGRAGGEEIRIEGGER